MAQELEAVGDVTRFGPCLYVLLPRHIVKRLNIKPHQPFRLTMDNETIPILGYLFEDGLPSVRGKRVITINATFYLLVPQKIALQYGISEGSRFLMSVAKRNVFYRFPKRSLQAA